MNEKDFEIWDGRNGSGPTDLYLTGKGWNGMKIIYKDAEGNLFVPYRFKYQRKSRIVPLKSFVAGTTCDGYIWKTGSKGHPVIVDKVMNKPDDYKAKGKYFEEQYATVQ